VANFAYDTYGDSNFDVEEVAASIPAGQTGTYSGVNSFDTYGSGPNFFTASTVIFGVYQNGTTTDPGTGDTIPTYGISIGYNQISASGILAAEADPNSMADTSYDGDNIPGYDTSALSVTQVSSDYDEPTIVQGLLDDGMSANLNTFAQNILYSSDEIGAINLQNSVPQAQESSLTLLNYSNATAGGTASIIQTVATPEPTTLLFSGVAGLTLLLGRPRIQRKRSVIHSARGGAS
jgi:hypothetical protein